MPYEIEMLAVGAADAIILRYLSDDQEVVVLIDAGNKKDGKKVVEHINMWTQQKYIDLAISTHPDNDHIGGFSYVLDNLHIDEFWIHDPNKHAVGAQRLLEDIQANNKLKKGLRYVAEGLENSVNLLTKIDSLGIRRDREPFEGLVYEFAPLTVVGPTVAYYTSQLSRFRDFDLLLKEEKELEKGIEGGKALTGPLSSRQILDKDDDKSKENNSSVLLLFEPEGRKYLFTSDAGPKALTVAAESYDLRDLNWLDVPHHGSRYNLTSNLIGLFNPGIAYISCDGSKHYPNPAVVEELKKVGCEVFSTAAGSKLHRVGTDRREGYSKAIPI
jgi:beta-lactamase superfamily II metal-dependent hydrolase